jgi:hypothetical protein
VSSGFERFMDADIPENMPLARDIREAARHDNTMPVEEYERTLIGRLRATRKARAT